MLLVSCQLIRTSRSNSESDIPPALRFFIMFWASRFMASKILQESETCSHPSMTCTTCIRQHDRQLGILHRQAEVAAGRGVGSHQMRCHLWCYKGDLAAATDTSIGDQL